MSNPKDLIISLPNSHLRQQSERIKVITPEIQRIIKDMKAATLDWEATRPHEVGVALAAIQIDQPYRIIIIRSNFDDKKDKGFKVFINPEIVKKEGALEADFEGCLSIKDVYGKVPRYQKVRVRALDENGNQIKIRAEGFLARVLQHEIDHIHGKVFVDHLENKSDAFYKLAEDGKLVEYEYDKVKAADLFR